MADKQKAVFHYAVARGFTPGIYTIWLGPTGAKVQTKGFGGAKFKKFATRREAEQFYELHKADNATDSTDISDQDSDNWRKDLAETIVGLSSSSSSASKAEKATSQRDASQPPNPLRDAPQPPNPLTHDTPHEAEKFILNRLTKLKTLHTLLPRPPATDPIDRQDLTKSIVTAQWCNENGIQVAHEDVKQELELTADIYRKLLETNTDNKWKILLAYTRNVNGKRDNQLTATTSVVYQCIDKHAQKERRHDHDKALIGGLKTTLIKLNDEIAELSRDYKIVQKDKQKYVNKYETLRDENIRLDALNTELNNETDRHTKDNSNRKRLDKTTTKEHKDTKAKLKTVVQQYNDTLIDLQRANVENNNLAAANRYLYSQKDISLETRQKGYQQTQSDIFKDRSQYQDHNQDTVDLVTPPTTPPLHAESPTTSSSDTDKWETSSDESGTNTARVYTPTTPTTDEEDTRTQEAELRHIYQETEEEKQQNDHLQALTRRHKRATEIRNLEEEIDNVRLGETRHARQVRSARKKEARKSVRSTLPIRLATTKSNTPTPAKQPPSTSSSQRKYQHNTREYFQQQSSSATEERYGTRTRTSRNENDEFQNDPFLGTDWQDQINSTRKTQTTQPRRQDTTTFIPCKKCVKGSGKKQGHTGSHRMDPNPPTRNPPTRKR